MLFGSNFLQCVLSLVARPDVLNAKVEKVRSFFSASSLCERCIYWNEMKMKMVLIGSKGNICWHLIVPTISNKLGGTFWRSFFCIE